MKILLFGPTGHVARSLLRLCAERAFQCATVSSSSSHADAKLDFLDQAAVESFDPPGGLGLDAVVFAQGINPAIGLSDATSSHFRAMYDVNIVTPALLVRKLQSRVRPGGVFIFLGSVASVRGSYDPAYGSAKAALVGLMNSLARYDRQHRYVVVSPALIDGSPVALSMPEERRAAHAQTMSGGELVKGDDVASAILAVARNGSLNRVELRVDRGMSE